MQNHQKTKYIADRVGLDIGSHSIKGVEVSERGSEMIVRAAGLITIPETRQSQDYSDSGAAVQYIKSLWSAAHFRSNKVILTLPSNAVYMKWSQLEASNDEELDHVARSAALRGSPFSADDAIVDYRVLSSRGAIGRNLYFVMLVAASSKAVESVLNTAENAGLEPLAVDIAPVAALKSFESQKRTTNPLWSGQPFAHCIIGAANTTIAVVRNGEMEFARTVPVGGNDITECIANTAEVSWQEAEKIKLTPGTRLSDSGILTAADNGGALNVPCENIVGRLGREILRSLRFFSSQFAEGSYLGMIGAATLSGGGALLKGIDACIQSQGIEVNSIINPFAGFQVEAEGGRMHNLGSCASQYTTAVGLALGDYGGSLASVQADKAA